MQFEYLVKESYQEQEDLNRLGKEGWELIQITQSRYIFKRPVQDENDWDNGEVVELPEDLDLKSFDEAMIRDALSVNNGDKKKVCAVLGISMHTLNRKIKEYNIQFIHI